MRQDTFEQGSSSVDAVDVIIGQWHVERPDLDPSAKEVTGRIVRLAGIFQQSYGESLAPLDISHGDFGVMAALRRAGAPFQLTPTDLARQRMMTSGGMTAAIDRLERRGMIERTPNPNDRRGNLVRLTDSGRVAMDTAFERHTDVEHRLVAALDDSERATLATLLRKLLLSVDTTV